MSKENQTHRESVKNKPSATVHQTTIDYISEMKSIRDYGELQFQVTGDYKKLINSTECEDQKSYYEGMLYQLTLILHQVGLSNDIY